MHTQVMGILNATPDSFFDGGHYNSIDRAIHHGQKLITEGADLIDIGGESTRPGAVPVSGKEEIQRTIPVIKALHKDIRISIDTSKAEVAAAAIEAGASMINDVTGLCDPEMIRLAIQADVPVCVMHMQGSPQTMQQNPHYPEGVVAEILRWFQEKITILVDQGVKPERLILDPGIGFGKSVADNLKILHNLSVFKALGFPILLGVSRKSFLQKIVSKPAVDMLAPTLGVNTLAIMSGVDIVRVHNVKEHRMLIQVLSEYKAIKPL